jgi:hypothetical protein
MAAVGVPPLPVIGGWESAHANVARTRVILANSGFRQNAKEPA